MFSSCDGQLQADCSCDGPLQADCLEEGLRNHKSVKLARRVYNYYRERKTHQDYADKLKNRLTDANKCASEEAAHKGEKVA